MNRPTALTIVLTIVKSFAPTDSSHCFRNKRPSHTYVKSRCIVIFENCKDHKLELLTGRLILPAKNAILLNKN